MVQESRAALSRYTRAASSESAFGLANQLGISREEAGAYIKSYFERFPGIRAYMDQTKFFVREKGYVTTIFGRKCHYPRVMASNTIGARF